MQQTLDLGHELTVDLFAGGGGASLGIERGLGRPVDIAVNHDRAALAQHRLNHPNTTHLCEDVFRVDPVYATRNQPVGLLWASPDCRHHSRAKGGKPVKKKIRGLAWVVVRWARRTRPRAIVVENVPEFAEWGPVRADGKPCRQRAGQDFRKWVSQLERLGYHVDWRILRASDYGAPTIRQRLFVIARRDGRPIVWPTPTHAAPDDTAVGNGRRAPNRTTAECIDWDIPCPSIFERKRPLAEATLARIARGIQRFILDHPQPFIVKNMTNNVARPVDAPASTVLSGNHHYLCNPFLCPLTHQGDRRTYSPTVPCPTVTGAHRGELALCAPSFTPLPTEDSAATVAAFLEQANTGMTGYTPDTPLSTIVSKGCTQRLVTAHLTSFHTGSTGRPLDTPAPTVTANSYHKRPGGAAPLGVCAAHLLQLKGADRRARALDAPAPAACAQGTHAALVTALLERMGVTSGTTAGMVTVTLDDGPYVITDIGLRMLTPRELYRAQGFPERYRIDTTPEGERLTKTTQVRLCGNSVPPQWPEAIVAANFRHERTLEAA